MRISTAIALTALPSLLGCVVGCTSATAATPPPELAPPAHETARREPAPLTSLTWADEPVERPRPRLSHTVTLGQDDGVYATPATVPDDARDPSVVINNVIVVNPPGYGAYGYGAYGYGYGGYGYGDYGRASHGVSYGRTVRGATTSEGAWPSGRAPRGWEGAQRTAPPGKTPGVGGNWSPPPSYGPATLR